MKLIFSTAIAIALPATLLLGCGPAHPRYPSYEAVLASGSPRDYSAEPLGDAPACAGECRCPRVRYDDRWVYHCDGRWVYYDRGLWWTYPHLYIYYVQGIPTVYRGPTRNIGPARSSRGFPSGEDASPRLHRTPSGHTPPSGTRNIGPPPKRSGD